jgi:ABC-type glycerol-3-phosphate transport system substrate-binding protein
MQRVKTSRGVNLSRKAYYADMALELAKQYNAALAGEVSPEQAVKTLQSDLKTIIEEGQAVG